MTSTMTAESRQSLLKQREEVLAAHNKAMSLAIAQKRYSQDEADALADAERHFEQVQHLEAEYFNCLPRVVLSCCPICKTPLERTMDPFGLDGPWWRSDASLKETPSCRHFCVLQGAVSFAGTMPRAAEFEVHTGPQVPFVIPRILEWPEMQVVLSEFGMVNGYTVFPVAYFASRRPPPQDLTASWPRTNYLYTTQLGEVQWRVPNDRHDFDLQEWRKSGRMHWCVTTGEEATIRSDLENCPLLDLPGERRATVVRGTESWYELCPADWTADAEGRQ